MCHIPEYAAKVVLNIGQVECGSVESYHEIVLLNRLTKVSKILIIHISRVPPGIEHPDKRYDSPLRGKSRGLDVNECSARSVIRIQPPSFSCGK